MTSDTSYDVLRNAVERLLPQLEELLKVTQNPAAKKKLEARIDQLKAALHTADE